MSRYDPHKHQRRSIRVPGYDYTHGWFFVTTCSHQRRPLFGQVVDGRMQLSPLGGLVVAEWEKTAVVRTAVGLDAYVVMPNHFHAIIALDGKGTVHRAPTAEQFGKPISGSLPTIIRYFKGGVTRRYNKSQQTSGIRVWQRGYYERIIRNERELNAIRDYIAHNPARWAEDRDNLDRLVAKMELRT